MGQGGGSQQAGLATRAAAPAEHPSPRPCPAVQLPELAEFEVGLANLFVQHTSASLTINENASPGACLPVAGGGGGGGG